MYTTPFSKWYINVIPAWRKASSSILESSLSLTCTPPSDVLAVCSMFADPPKARATALEGTTADDVPPRKYSSISVFRISEWVPNTA